MNENGQYMTVKRGGTEKSSMAYVELNGLHYSMASEMSVETEE